MIERFLEVGSIGVIEDQDPYNLPNNAVTETRNIRFIDGNAQKMTGHSQVYTGLSVAPYWVHPVAISGTQYWLYNGNAQVYATEGTNHYQLTPITVTATAFVFTGDGSDTWNGGKINNIPVFTNGKDSPVMWDTLDTGQKLNFLTWDSSNTWLQASKSCEFIRPFREFLIAGNMTESGTNYPKRLRWSTSAASGAVPSTWDDTDTTEDAGYTDFSESSGDLVDCGLLRHLNIIYTENQTHAMSYVGGNDIFTFDSLFTNLGLLARRCWTEFFGKHLVMTAGDVVVHDSASVESIISKRMQKWLFNQIDTTNYAQSYVVPNYPKNEIWICFPVSGSTYPDIALVWNYIENNFAVRELPNASFIGAGIVDPNETATFDADVGTYDASTASFDERSYNPTQTKLLIVDPTNTKLYQADDTNQFDGTNFTAYFERTGLDFGTPHVKRVKRIYPRVNSSSSITIRVGYEMVKGEGVTWTSYTYDPTTQEKIETRVTGRFLAFRFESTGNITWETNSFDVEYDVMGRY